MTEKEYWIWFASLNILPIKKYKIFESLKSVDKIFFAETRELLMIQEINLNDIFEIQKSKDINLIKKYEDYINKNQIDIININDKLYPKKLKNIYDPPVVLFAKGNVELLKNIGIAVIGSRDANEYGKRQAYNLGYNLAKYGYSVISGLAKGIDGAAHLGALKATGNTIAVIGSGLDVIYPKENLNLYKSVFEKGLIISEFIVGTKPLAKNFPMRNRIVSGLSSGVVVAQAKEQSGAMITVDLALEQGKNVYAIPRKHRYTAKLWLQFVNKSRC